MALAIGRGGVIDLTRPLEEIIRDKISEAEEQDRRDKLAARSSLGGLESFNGTPIAEMMGRPGQPVSRQSSIDTGSRSPRSRADDGAPTACYRGRSTVALSCCLCS